MSNFYPPISEDVGFNPDNFIDTTDDNLDINELEQIFAKKFNMNISGVTTASGDININDNKSIFLNNNQLHSFNKCKRFEYQLETKDNKSSVSIPISFDNPSASNLSKIYLCSLTRNDGIFSIINTNPVFTFYLIASDYSVMSPIPIIQNQIQSYEYNETDKILSIDFDRLYTSDFSVLFSMNQIQ